MSLLDKTDAEIAVERFEQADKEYREMEQRFLNGEYLSDIESKDIERMKENHQQYVEKLKAKQEDRNVKRRVAADALRASVSLTSTQTRGPDGKPTISKIGSFWVSSVTRRSFDPGDFQRMCNKYPGLWETITLETSKDKDGSEYHIVKQTLDIDYEKVLLWLKANGYNDVIQVAYEEKELTPMVKGPKALSFLGDERKD